MKNKLLALIMAFMFLFSPVSVLASQVDTTAADQDAASSEATTLDTTEDTSTTSNTTEDSSTISDTTVDTSTETGIDSSMNDSATLSTIQTPSDGGCIISSGSSSGLDLGAEAAILMDAASGSILYSKNIDTKLYPASITKIMTTLVALENGNLSDSVICNAETLYAIEQDSSRVGLEAGEIISLEDALYFVILQSGNDAAAVAAEHVGGSVDGFVNMMNEKAQELGCTNTHFMNPHGLHHEEHYTSARDMALIMQAAVQNPDFCRIASATNFTVGATNLNDSRGVWNHHKMILPASEYHYDGVCEGKNGFTTMSLNTLVTTAERNGIKLIAVVLRCQGAQVTYSDTKKLFDYGFDNFTILKPLQNFNLKTAAQDAGLSEENLDKLSRYNAVYNTDYTVFAPASVNVSDIHMEFSSDGPSNGVFGKIVLTYNNEEIGSLNVYYDIEAEYKTIENSDTSVNITEVSNVPFILIGIMAALIILIIILTVSIIIRP